MCRRFVLIALFCPGLCWAQRKSLNPELFWQPPSGQVAATLSYLYDSVEFSDTVSGAEETREGDGQGGRLDLEYGLFSLLSLGAAFQYKYLETTVDEGGTATVEKREGPTDYEFSAKMIIPSDRTRLYFGVSYLLGSENSTEDTGLNRFNQALGGPALRPYFAVQFPMGPIWVGLRGEWALFEDRTVEVDGVETAVLSGGDELDVLANFELNTGDFALGVGAGVFMKQKEETTVIATGTVATNQSYEKTHYLVYSRFEFAHWLSLILRGDYFETVEQEISTTVLREEGKELRGVASLRFKY